MSFDGAAFLATVPHTSGVYRMYGLGDAIIYIGKAGDLKKRLSQYFQKTAPNLKTALLVSEIVRIEFTVTFSETEALILESNLIKKFQPKYNILLKDDKGYPHILLTDERHPRLCLHRGAKNEKGTYFGPYPSSGAAREALLILQKIFPVRQCADTVYRSRKRPCLLSQLGRCLAPCVPGNCSDEAYRKQAEMCALFLQGRDRQLIADLVGLMDEAAANLDYEKAIRYRDQLASLRKVQERQSVSGEIGADLDILGCAVADGLACVHVLFIRTGKIIGTRSYYPKLPADNSPEYLLEAFIGQFYLSGNGARALPAQIVAAYELADRAGIEEALRRKKGRAIALVAQVRGERARYLRLAEANAAASLKARLAHETLLSERIEAFEELFGLSGIRRLECFDVSHTMGELTVASCVVFGRGGPETREYRRFNIAGIAPGDDFAAMRQALSRRFRGITAEGKVPEVLFIDGGLGQLREAEEVTGELFAAAPPGVAPPFLVGIAKGEGRRPGLETLITGFTHEEYRLTLDNPALQLALHIRDESHRFAITGHRRRREKSFATSRLQDIPGIGPARRQALLKYMGGLRAIRNASAEEIAKVPGISLRLAGEIYDRLHG